MAAARRQRRCRRRARRCRSRSCSMAGAPRRLVDGLHLIFRSLTLTLLWNTVRLTVVVTLLCAVIGIAAAWCVERTDLPCRRFWAVLLVVPLAIPDFVLSFGWTRCRPAVRGFRGAVLVMTLAVYPLVYLPVAASLRSADPGLEEVARSLGVGRLAYLLPGHARPGARRDPRRLPARRAGHARRVRRVRDPRLPDLHDRDLHRVPHGFDLLGGLRALARPRRCSASSCSRRRLRSRPRPRRRRGPLATRRRAAPARAAPRCRCCSALGAWSGSRSACRSAPIGYWMAQSRRHRRSRRSRSSTPPPHRRVQRARPRRSRRCSRCRSRCSRSATAAAPGADRAQHLPRLGDARARGRARVRLLPAATPAATSTRGVVLVVAYAMLFFPLALVAVRASVAQAPLDLEEVGALARPAAGWRCSARVTLPLLAPGPRRGLLSRLPLRVDRADRDADPHPDRRPDARDAVLGVQAEPLLRAAAPYALLIIASRRCPSYVLGRCFDRLPRPAPGARHERARASPTSQVFGATRCSTAST